MTSPVTPADYTHKGPNIQVIEYQYNITALNAVEDWLNNGDVEEYSVYPSGTGPSINVTDSTGTVVLRVSNGRYIARDVNNKLFTLDKDLLNAFYDVVS